MHKPKWLFLASIPVLVMGLVFSISTAQAQTPSSTPHQKSIPTYPAYSVTNKHVKPNSYVSSCPIGSLPQPGIVKIGVPNTNPAYAYHSLAIGISGGQPYQILGGYVRGTPEQGVIHVESISTDPCKDFITQMGKPAAQSSPTEAVVSAQTKEGSITITGVKGDTVSYVSAAGKTGHFNYVTKIFQP